MKWPVFFIDRNIHGAWVVYGACGIRQYYGFTKKQAEEEYRKSCDIVTEVKNGR